jgi:alanine dehydrogenase
MTTPQSTLLLARDDVAALLSLDECIAKVEEVFRQYGEGKVTRPKVLGVAAVGGGFHIKAAMLEQSVPYFAAKLNGNFFGNQQRFAMPNIQGLLLLCDARNGYPLAVMDSIEITILRTGAATAVAAKYLARPNSRVATVWGCGRQGRVQLRALTRVLPLQNVYAFDVNDAEALRFAEECSRDFKINVEAVREPAPAVRKSDVCVTCTPAKKYFLDKDFVQPGTFVAAVGADNEEKQELDPLLLASNKVVADMVEQCAEIGDLHHAIAAGLMGIGDVHAELGEVAAGRKPGRTCEQEITIFDSTGTALQDVAAAAVVYERATKSGHGVRFRF